MGFAKQWKGINGSMIRDPTGFLESYRERHGVGYPLAFMLVSVVVSMLPIIGITTALNITDPGIAVLAIGLVFGFAIVAWIASVLEALCAHAIASLFGGDGIVLTLEAYAFPLLVRYGLWWIPIVNIALGLYGLYLQIKGLATFHDLETGQAAIAAIVATVLVAIIFIPLIILGGAVIFAFIVDLGEPATGPGPGP